MKLIGLSCGRKNGNGEILLKEAMLAAQEAMDVDVEIIRLLELDLLPCTGCEVCTLSMMRGGDGLCRPHKDKDHMNFLRDKFAEADGMIIAAPVFELTAPGYLKVMNERFLGFGPDFLMAVFESSRKRPKIGATIAVGGTDWTHPAIPLMNIPLFMLQMKVVDQLQVNWVARPGHVLLKDEAMAQARRLGQRVAASMGKPFAELKYLGDDPGLCPQCHCRMFILGSKREVTCPVCDTKGIIHLEGGEIRIQYDEVSLAHNRWTPEGMQGHFGDVKRQHEVFDAQKQEVAARGRKYRNFAPYVRPALSAPRESTDEGETWAEAMLGGSGIG
jgi:multimeric flavodoxin WrbA